jgi:glycosyltransferase involved in cell wall biosynthesis
VSVPLDQPSDWIIDRESREYRLADHIVVLSSFALRSFVDQGIPREKISLLPLGVQVDAFRASPADAAARAARIRRGDPLTVLYVGAVSYRKGLWDLARVAAAVDPARVRFLLVGKVMPEAEAAVARLGPHVTMVAKMPQAELPSVYRQGDVFLFPTIEDGFGVVLAQAQAAGLPIITTPNGAGGDLVRSDADGWIVPIRDAEAITERLQWCDAHRDALGRMAEAGSGQVRSRSWTEVAGDFEKIVRTRQAGLTRGVLADAG